MQFKRLYTILCLGISVILVACGGDDASQSPSAAQKVAVRQKATATDYSDTVQELYIAYFGRPADPGGLANFEAALLADNAPTGLPTLSADYGSNAAFKSLIDSFGNSTESQTLYGGSTTSAFVTQIFQNVLGRAPAAAGLSYWTNAIDNQGLSKGNAAASIMAGAMTNNTAAGQIDAQTIMNKVSVAANFTAALNVNPSVYKGQAAAASARSMLAQVLSTTVPSNFQSTVTATIASITAAQSSSGTLTASAVQACPNVSSNDMSFYQCLEGSMTGTMTTATGSQPCTLTIDSGGNYTLASGTTKLVFSYPYSLQGYVKQDLYNQQLGAFDPTLYALVLSIQSNEIAGYNLFSLAADSPAEVAILNKQQITPMQDVVAVGQIGTTALTCTFNF
jgi:hypothetical protein